MFREIEFVFPVSSKGKTQVFGTCYQGSNPCAGIFRYHPMVRMPLSERGHVGSNPAIGTVITTKTYRKVGILKGCLDKRIGSLTRNVSSVVGD